MERYNQISKEDLELLSRLLPQQSRSFLQESPYIEQRVSVESGPSLEERRRYYNGIVKDTFVLAGITSAALAIVTPFRSIPFCAFAVILFASRIADVLSTIFCLRIPTMYETNPHCEAHRLSAEVICKHLFSLLALLGPAYLLSLCSPIPIKLLLLTYTISSFVVAVSNLYQAFSLSRASTLCYAISSSLVGICVLFLARLLF